MLLGLLAIGATLASTASGAAKKLELTWISGTQELEPGYEVNLIGYSGVSIETSGGTVTCVGETGFEGSLILNDEPTDTVNATIGPGGEPCTSTIPLGGEVTVAFILGAFHHPSDLGVLSLKAKGKAELVAQSREEPDYVQIESTAAHYAEVCRYSFYKLKGTLTLQPWEETGLARPVVDFVKQKLAVVKGWGELCPKKATLSIPAMYLTHREGELEWPVYGSLL